MRTTAALLVLVVGAGCATRPVPVQEPLTPGPQPTISAAPEEVGGFRLTETERFPDPSLGTLYRYRNGSALEPDVYVYPLTETARGGGTHPREQAHAESALLKQTLAIMRDRRRFDAYELVSEQALEQSAGAGPVHGWHVHALLTRRGEQRDSHQHLFVVGEQLVKVRSTFPRGAVAADELDAFVESLIQGMLAR